MLHSHTFPRNDLLNMTVRVRNITDHTVYMGLTLSPYTCGSTEPVIHVSQSHRTLLFPPAVPGLFSPSCPPTTGRHGPFHGAALQPGASRTWTQQVILRGRILQAVAMIVDGKHVDEVQSKAMWLNLTDEPSLSYTYIPGKHPSLTLDRPAGVTGPLLAAQSWECTTNDLNGAVGTEASGGGQDLRPVPSLTLSPGADSTYTRDCATLIQWNVAAGWLNYPVIEITRYTPARSYAVTSRARTAQTVVASNTTE
jgi:hypothetical protein